MDLTAKIPSPSPSSHPPSLYAIFTNFSSSCLIVIIQEEMFLVSFLEGDRTLHSMPCADQCSWFGKARLEVDFDGEAAAPTDSTPSEPAPHPRRRRRRRARGAAKLSLPYQLLTNCSHRRPLKHHRPASDGLHTVLTVGRPAMLSFASLNMDSSTSLPPQAPTSSPWALA